LRFEFFGGDSTKYESRGFARGGGFPSFHNSSGALRLLCFDPLPFLPADPSAVFLLPAALPELDDEEEGSKRATEAKLSNQSEKSA
jgi:hypothetical protein